MSGWLEQLQTIDPETIPHSLCVYLSAVTTVVIRTLAYVFLRWIPGPWIPKVISPSIAIFVPAFLALALSKPLFITKSEKTSISVHPKEDIIPTEESGSHAATPAHSNGSLVVEAARVKISKRATTPPWKTLVLGIPSLIDNPALTLTTLLLNILCFAAVYDATYTLPTYYKAQDLSFARTGWVTEHSAKILVREPPTSEFVKSAPVYVVSWVETLGAESEKSAKNILRWNTAQLDAFTEGRDYTSSVLVTGLKPLTTYRYLTTGIIRDASPLPQRKALRENSPS